MVHALSSPPSSSKMKRTHSLVATADEIVRPAAFYTADSNHNRPNYPFAVLTQYRLVTQKRTDRHTRDDSKYRVSTASRG